MFLLILLLKLIIIDSIIFIKFFLFLWINLIIIFIYVRVVLIKLLSVSVMKSLIIAMLLKRRGFQWILVWPKLLITVITVFYYCSTWIIPMEIIPYVWSDTFKFSDTIIFWVFLAGKSLIIYFLLKVINLTCFIYRILLFDWALFCDIIQLLISSFFPA